MDVFHPHDTHLEEVILGACLAESAAMPLVADKLRPELFYEDPHREICQALQSLYRYALYGLPTDKVSKYPADGLGVVIIAKQRNGETGEVYFSHNPRLTKMGTMYLRWNGCGNMHIDGI
jgi:replicative DNA helicase